MTRGPVRAVLSCLAMLACPGGAALAQQPVPPPVRPLGPITHVAAESLASVATAVPVSGGRVYVNDITGRRLLLFDPDLARATVVADSAGSAEAYGTAPGTLLPYRGDSALFISPSALSMLVLTREGAVARVMATPPSGRGPGLMGLIGSIFGTPGFDARGRLAYFLPVNLIIERSPATGQMRLEPPDSALVVRFDFASRTLDTAAAIRIPRTRSVLTRNESGRPIGITMTALPPATVDDWAVTSDGTIAIVRGRDYHVDWLAPEGTWSSTPRMAFSWERLDDDQKNSLLDSMVATLQVQMDSNLAQQERVLAGASSGQRSAPASRAGGGVTMAVVTTRGEAAPGAGDGATVTRTTSAPRPTVARAELSDVPDYRPPFGQGAVRADAEGRLWIRTSKMLDGRPVYDIVSRQGVVVDRLQLPPNRTIAGFGPGVVYMGVRDSLGATHLERARIR